MHQESGKSRLGFAGWHPHRTVSLPRRTSIRLKPLPEGPASFLGFPLLNQLDDLTPEGMLENGASRERVVKPRGLKQRSVDRLRVGKLGFGPLKDAGHHFQEI